MNKGIDLEQEIDRLIDKAIEEDIGSGDITSDALIPEHAITSGRFFLKQAAVVAGLPILERLFKKFHEDIKIKHYVEEGSHQKAGTIIAKISGPARAILTGERVALNIVQHASSVATTTWQYVRKIAGLNCEILDTRKTLPGLRALEKYAVRIGGGTNHRKGLNDRIVIKNNHLSFVEGYPKITTAVEKVKARHPDIPIEIEIYDISQLEEALKTEAQAIMLSRMTPYEIIKCVKRIRQKNKKVYVESLGTITLDTIHAYAETGVDGISIGSLTTSVQSFIDIGMRLTTHK